MRLNSTLPVMALAAVSLIACHSSGDSAGNTPTPASAGTQATAPDKVAAKPATVAVKAAVAAGAPADAQQIEADHKVFVTTCSPCHQVTGLGLPGMFPPLAKSDFLMADKQRSIHIVLHGLTGPVTVNGKTFNAVMPTQAALSDKDLANVLTYVRNSWGNKGEGVHEDEVKKVRTELSASGK